MAVQELSHAPDLRALYAKAVVGSLPGRAGGDELPNLELALPEVEIDRAHLAAYCRVCGFRLTDELPPTYLHVFAFPLAMRLMTDRGFPLPLLGLVHVSNRIAQERPARTSERPSLRVRAEGLRRHERGTEVKLVAEAELGSERVWSSVSTYLRRGGSGGSSSGSSGGGGKGASPGRDRGGGAGAGAAAEDTKAAARPGTVTTWRIPGDMGRRYAAVSGDVNPIHLHPLTARLFGFPRAIAHGMWTKARCLAALEGRLPERMAAEVDFRKPLLLPSEADFRSTPSDGGRSLDLRDRRTGAPHLSGSVRPA